MSLELDNPLSALADLPLADILGDVGDSLILLDREGRYVYVNRRAAALTGVSSAKLVGMTAWRADADGASRQLHVAVQKVFEQQEPVNFRIRDPQSRVLMEVRLYPAGPYVAVLGRDVSMRCRKEPEERDCDTCFRAATVEVEVGLAYVGLDGQWLQASQRLCEILGYANEELLRLNFRDTCYPPDLRNADAHADSLMAGESASRVMECRFVRADGAIVLTQLTMFLARDGEREPQFYVAAVEDVDERERAIGRLRKSEERFRLFVENAPVAVAMLDREMRYIAASNRWYQDYKIADDIIGLCHYDVFPDLPEYWKAVHRRGLAGSTERADEDRFERDDGSVTWLKWEVRPWYDSTGDIGGVMIYTDDITRQKLLEAQVLQAQKLDSVGRLAGGIAHDFNNLLTAILGFAEMAQEECDPDSPLQEHLRNVVQPARSAARLTQQLLAFAKQQAVTPRVVDVSHLISNTAGILRRLVPENIDLCIQPMQALIAVKVDPGQFAQILVNLVVNARDAMPEGGRIAIIAQNVVVQEGQSREHDEVAPGSYVRVAVSDTGAGINDAVKPRIFEPFFSTKGNGRGTGLGLATVYGIVRQAGGYVWLRSQPGAGTTFNVYLPCTAERPDVLEVEAPVQAQNAGSETILVAEDEAPVRALAVLALKAQGYTVLEAGDGLEALKAAAGREKEITLLITDVIMPKMGGRELAERLQSRHPGIKVLFTSGYADDFGPRGGSAGQELRFLPKPFTPSVLLHKVRALLDSRPAG